MAGDDAQLSAAQQIAEAAQAQRDDEQVRRDAGESYSGSGIGYGASTSTTGVRGGGYRLSDEDLERYIAEFTEIAREIKEDDFLWRTAHEAVQPTSGDSPARRHAEAMKASIMAGWQANIRKFERMVSFIDQMKEAHRGYQRMEDDVASSVGERSIGESAGSIFGHGGETSSQPDRGSLFDKGNSQ